MSSHVTVRGPGGQTAIDRELYLPEPWTGNPDQCRTAGIPDGTMFATRPKLARRMIARTLDARVPAEWAAGDEACGANPGLCADLEKRQIGYVLIRPNYRTAELGPVIERILTCQACATRADAGECCGCDAR